MWTPWSPLGWKASRPRSSNFTFTPADLTPTAWWKGDVGTTIVTGVSQWDDQSGNANHLVQAVGANQPALTAGAINGIPCLTFDGTNDNMAVAFALVQPFTLFMVVRQVTWVSTRDFCDGATLADSMLIQQFTATPNLRIFAGASLTGANTLAVNTFGLVTAIFNGASSVVQINNDTEITGNASVNAPGGFTLGSRQTGTAFSNIGVAEAFIVPSVVSGANRTNVKQYVFNRFGI